MNNFTKSIVYSGVVLVAGLVAVFTIYNNMAVTDGAGYANIEPAAGISAAAPRTSGVVSGANSMAQEAGVKATQAVQNASKSIRDASDHGHADDIESNVEEAIETIVDEATDEAMEGIPADATDAQVDAAEDAAEEAAEEVVEDAVDEANDAAEEAAQDAAEDTATEGDDL